MKRFRVGVYVARTISYNVEVEVEDDADEAKARDAALTLVLDGNADDDECYAETMDSGTSRCEEIK